MIAGKFTDADSLQFLIEDIEDLLRNDAYWARFPSGYVIGLS
jgi:hypothetical protein